MKNSFKQSDLKGSFLTNEEYEAIYDAETKQLKIYFDKNDEPRLLRKILQQDPDGAGRLYIVQNLFFHFQPKEDELEALKKLDGADVEDAELFWGLYVKLKTDENGEPILDDNGDKIYDTHEAQSPKVYSVTVGDLTITPSGERYPYRGASEEKVETVETE